MDMTAGMDLTTPPSAYTIAQIAGRYYPMRFGRFRLDARGLRISYDRHEDAVAMCWHEQRQYEHAYPAPADTAGQGGNDHV